MTYELPRGNIITAGAERVRVSTLKHLIVDVVAMKCYDSEKIWHRLHPFRDSFANVVLSSGLMGFQTATSSQSAQDVPVFPMTRHHRGHNGQSCALRACPRCCTTQFRKQQSVVAMNFFGSRCEGNEAHLCRDGWNDAEAAAGSAFA